VRYKYSVSPENQLLLQHPKTKSIIKLPGRFKIEKNNRLTYQLDSPFELKHKITFSGAWRLNENHDLELVLDKVSSERSQDILTIKGDIIRADRGVLAFEVKTIDQDGLLHAQVIELGITWFSDEKNRLSFLVRDNKSGRITLQCAWKINKNLQIQYTYEKSDLVTGVKSKNTLVFDGFWQIAAKNKLVYKFIHDSDSCFELRALLETPTIYPKKNAIKYRIGVGFKQGRRDNLLSFYGSWKLNRELGLDLTLDYGQAGLKNMEFATSIALNKNNEVKFNLKSPQGEPLGLAVILTHKFLKTSSAQAFLRLKSQGKNYGVDAGIFLPF